MGSIIIDSRRLITGISGAHPSPLTVSSSSWQPIITIHNVSQKRTNYEVAENRTRDPSFGGHIALPLSCIVTVRGAILCVSTTKKGDNDQPKRKKKKRQKPTPPATVELLDFRVQNSVIFCRITREIAHQP